MYLPDSRTNPDDWKTGKSVEDIQKIKAAGGFVDLIQWRAARSSPVGMTDDGYMLEWRNSDDGKNPFVANADPATKLPKFMWDEKKTGYKAITADKLRKGENHLIREVNGAPFDPNAGRVTTPALPTQRARPPTTRRSPAGRAAAGPW